MGITLNSDWHEPRNEYREADIDADNRVMQFFLGWFAHPVFVGDYPEVMKVIAITCVFLMKLNFLTLF